MFKSPRGSCSLYLWHEGAIGFIARLNALPNAESSLGDAGNWHPTSSGGEKTSFLSADGRTLLFRSQQQLTAYENHGSSELYRYREGEPLACLSCNPTGAAPQGVLDLGQIRPSALRGAEPATLASRNLSADGNRAFFETTEALVAADTDGAGGCPLTGSKLQSFPACLDVYEWEAPGSGSCEAAAPPYSPPNGGCLYLLSPGEEATPALFADASASGNDVFFYTRSRLVGQDTDQLLDVYDARVGGGLAAQNPPPPAPPCEAEGCKPAPTPAPQLPGAATPGFHGPGNPAAKPHHKRKHHKKKHHHKRKHKGHHHSKRRTAR